MKKKYIIEFDFDDSNCPLMGEFGCQHPQPLKYIRCNGETPPENCPLEEYIAPPEYQNPFIVTKIERAKI